MNLLYLPPPSLPIDAETAVDAAEYDYAPNEEPSDDQPLSVELPGKQSPLDHPDIAYSFPLVLALDLAIVDDPVDPIMMHSLLL